MLDGYVSEKEQIESIQKWWRENGKVLMIAIVIGLAIGFGWRYFHKVELRRAETAATLYQSVLQAQLQQNSVTVDGGAKLLMQHFSDSPFASLAALIVVKNKVMENKLPDALINAQWVIAHSDQKQLQQMARLDAARILLSQHNTTAAMNALTIVNDKHFEPLIAWVRGDIYTQEGNAKKATENYTDAKNALAEFPPAVNFMDKQIAQPIK